MKTGYIWDQIFLGHDTSAYHPENPLRVKNLDFWSMEKELQGLEQVKNLNDLGRTSALRIHSNDYLLRFEKDVDTGRQWFDYFDTKIRPDTFEVALRSVSAAVSLTKQVCEGKINNGFAAIRPPGHHARVEKAKGFCFFNNVAICARYAQQVFSLKNILIIDWDVHPGDGTTNIFYDDPSVFVVSVHQDGIFNKAVGATTQTGSEEGEGSIFNIPIKERGDINDYLRLFEPELLKAAELCKPDMIFISCGFDAHYTDPVGNMKLDEKSFQRFTKLTMDIANKYCGGKIVSLLEGGYNTNTLRSNIRAHVETLMD